MSRTPEPPKPCPSDGDVLSILIATIEDLNLSVQALTAQNVDLVRTVADLKKHVLPTAKETAKERRTRLEMQAIRAISDVGPDVSAVAAAIGVSRTTLHGWDTFMKVVKKEAGRQEQLRLQRQQEKEDEGWTGDEW